MPWHKGRRRFRRRSTYPFGKQIGSAARTRSITRTQTFNKRGQNFVNGNLVSFGPSIKRRLNQRGLPSNFPRTARMKLRYNCEFALDSGTVTFGDKVFRANSPYDPEYSAGGHSAYLFDEMMQFYGKYRVVGSKIRIWYINPAVSDQIPSYVTIIKSKDPDIKSQFASTDHILESNMRSRVKIIGQFAVANQLQQSQAATLTMGYSQRKYFPGILDEQLEATYAADPSLVAYYHVMQFPLGGNNPPISYFRAEITYSVLFSELIVLPESGVNRTTGVEATPGGTGPIGSYSLNSVNQTLGGFTGAGGTTVSIPSLNG